MVPYIDFNYIDTSGINVEMYDKVNQIAYLNKDNFVPLHRHKFYEMVFIQRGSCRHFYKNDATLLIPGDVFLISPDETHSYQFDESICMYNCQFYPEILHSSSSDFIKELTFSSLKEQAPLHHRMQDMYNLWEEMDEKPVSPPFMGNINAQGILHLNFQQQSLIASYLNSILAEQSKQGYEYVRMKQMYLGIMLVTLIRIKKNQFDAKEHTPSWQSEMVLDALNRIDAHLDENFDFIEEAARQHITPSYYRMIFKKITGLSPLEYLNRVRILRALELLQTTYLSVGEVADAVGIHDPNYFSRLFKKLVGCPPSYYKSI